MGAGQFFLQNHWAFWPCWYFFVEANVILCLYKSGSDEFIGWDPLTMADFKL